MNCPSPTRTGNPKTLGIRISRQWNFSICWSGCWEGKCLLTPTQIGSINMWMFTRCSTIWLYPNSAACTLNLANSQLSPSLGVKTAESKRNGREHNERNYSFWTWVILYSEWIQQCQIFISCMIYWYWSMNNFKYKWTTSLLKTF